MMIVRATKRLLQRLPASRQQDGERSTTVLGDWYATALFWKPQQVVLLVNEATLLPAFMPLAPAASLPARIGEQIAATLATSPRHPTPSSKASYVKCATAGSTPTASRSIIGIMNEFTRLAEHHRSADPATTCTRSLPACRGHPAARCTAGTSARTGSYTRSSAPASNRPPATESR